jgi:hypothetical protein
MDPTSSVTPSTLSSQTPRPDAALAAASPPRQRPRGWTFALGVPDLVAPYAPSDDVRWFRGLLDDDGQPASRPHTWHSGLLSYAGLGSTEAKALLQRLPPDVLDDRQNLSPTLGSFLRAAVEHPRVVELVGYCVGPDRSDERFSVTGALLYAHPELHVEMPRPWDGGRGQHSDACQCVELWALASDEYGLDDAESPPDEYGSYWARHRPGEHCWRLWWD